MFTMRLISNQKGAGMLLAGVAFAALGAAAFMMGDIFLNAEEVVKKDSSVTSYQLMVDTVRKNLYAGNNCTEALSSTSSLRSTGGLGVLNIGVALNLSSQATLPRFDRGVKILGLPVKLYDSAITLESGWKSKSGTSIKSIRLIVDRIADLPAPYDLTEPSTADDRIVRFNYGGMSLNLKAADAYLVIEPDHKGINIWAPENKKYWIKLYAYVDPAAGSIHSCSDPTSEVAFCTEVMNGTYVNDPTLAADKRCRPDLNCFTFKQGVIPVGSACPDADYVETLVGTDFKTCKWCPATPYSLPSVTRVPGGEKYQDISDLMDLDCSAANPYGALSPREAWDEFSLYQDLRGRLTPEQQEQYAGCINYDVPCYDYPESCSNNCGGPQTCSCVTDIPDDPATCQNECTGDRSSCPCVDDPGTCANECTGDRTSCVATSCKTGIPDDPDTECYNECAGRARPKCNGDRR